MRSAQSVSRASTPLPVAACEPCPLPRQDVSDSRNAPGGDTFVGEDDSSRKRVAAASASVVSTIASACPDCDDRIRKTSFGTGKAPRQGISSSRVEADCRRTGDSPRWNRQVTCGKVVEYAFCCGLRWKTQARIWNARCAKKSGRDMSRPPKSHPRSSAKICG